MTIKNDEILLIKTILKYCKKSYDMIPTEEIFKLDIPEKRILYLLEKLFNKNIINCGVGVAFGWIDMHPYEIKDYYKRNGVEL